MRKAVIGSLAHWENPKDAGFTEKRQAITSTTHLRRPDIPVWLANLV